MLCMRSIGIDGDISELCYKGTILQLHGEKIGYHNMILYPNPSYKMVRYKETALYL